ncbi:hypothetical protein L208DRAFT_1315277 [Tricholoma matsutake]|nr:hypothetical protein L208DRAFT_1315277 [Tricholoma matsutake 945]
MLHLSNPQIYLPFDLPFDSNAVWNMMLVNISGLPGHAMAIDLNIEHLIGSLKALFASKGIYANWDHLGNLSATTNHLQKIKTQVTQTMETNYQGSIHKDINTNELVWWIANKAHDLQLQDFIPNREGNS